MEAEITINGKPLSEGQAMTVRVALENFASDLKNGLGKDAIGKAICSGYKARIEEIRLMIYKL
jgi:hypothetical protein